MTSADGSTSSTHSPLSSSPAFQALQQHHLSMLESGTQISQLFDADQNRFSRLSLSAAGLFLDYSKNLITESTVKLLTDLAHQRGVAQQRAAMFAGERINFTEGRSVLHTALRAPRNQPLVVDGVDVNAQVYAVLDRLQTFVAKVHSGEWRGATGKAITDVVNIGIGGSDLGPKMVCQALRCFADRGIRSHFVSNVDGHDLDAVLAQVDRATTLFVVSSKTFTTAETMLNAHSARSWFLREGKEADLARHFVAVTTNLLAAAGFGIDAENCFGFWDWVGGRYSLWSAIGLPIALTVGFDRFRALLDGAHAMDRHFCDAPFDRNLPVLMALVGIWNRDVLGAQSVSIAAYHQDLAAFPSYLQQLDMESNGKGVTRDGDATDVPTGPIIWGNTGTNAQHAYFQLLHQGSDITPVDFIATLTARHSLPGHHRMLLANCFAQSQALMKGKSAGQVQAEMQAAGTDADAIRRLTPHRVFAGNRPSNTLLLDELNPFSLGALIALYEHKVAVQGFCWGINSFDQWGVELGKVLAKTIEADIGSSGAVSQDSSTAGLIALARAAKAT